MSASELPPKLDLKEFYREFLARDYRKADLTEERKVWVPMKETWAKLAHTSPPLREEGERSLDLTENDLLPMANDIAPEVGQVWATTPIEGVDAVIATVWSVDVQQIPQTILVATLLDNQTAHSFRINQRLLNKYYKLVRR